MRVGDEIRAAPSDYTPPQPVKAARGLPLMAHASPPERAVVEFIHPARRFYTVRFYYKFGSFCESFPIRKGT